MRATQVNETSREWPSCGKENPRTRPTRVTRPGLPGEGHSKALRDLYALRDGQPLCGVRPAGLCTVSQTTVLGEVG